MSSPKLTRSRAKRDKSTAHGTKEAGPEKKRHKKTPSATPKMATKTHEIQTQRGAIITDIMQGLTTYKIPKLSRQKQVTTREDRSQAMDSYDVDSGVEKMILDDMENISQRFPGGDAFSRHHLAPSADRPTLTPVIDSSGRPIDQLADDWETTPDVENSLQLDDVMTESGTQFVGTVETAQPGHVQPKADDGFDDDAWDETGEDPASLSSNNLATTSFTGNFDNQTSRGSFGGRGGGRGQGDWRGRGGRGRGGWSSSNQSSSGRTGFGGFKGDQDQGFKRGFGSAENTHEERDQPWRGGRRGGEKHEFRGRGRGFHDNSQELSSNSTRSASHHGYHDYDAPQDEWKIDESPSQPGLQAGLDSSNKIPHTEIIEPKLSAENTTSAPSPVVTTGEEFDDDAWDEDNTANPGNVSAAHGEMSQQQGGFGGSFGSRSERGGFGRGGDRSERGGFGRGGDRSERGGFGRGGDRSERGGFGRGGDRSERGGFGRGGDRSERGGFGRGGDRSERGGFGRGGDRSERGGFGMGGDRSERGGFGRGGDRFGDRSNRGGFKCEQCGFFNRRERRGSEEFGERPRRGGFGDRSRGRGFSSGERGRGRGRGGFGRNAGDEADGFNSSSAERPRGGGFGRAPNRSGGGFGGTSDGGTRSPDGRSSFNSAGSQRGGFGGAGTSRGGFGGTGSPRDGLGGTENSRGGFGGIDNSSGGYGGTVTSRGGFGSLSSEFGTGDIPREKPEDGTSGGFASVGQEPKVDIDISILTVGDEHNLNKTAVPDSFEKPDFSDELDENKNHAGYQTPNEEEERDESKTETRPSQASTQFFLADGHRGPQMDTLGCADQSRDLVIDLTEDTDENWKLEPIDRDVEGRSISRSKASKEAAKILLRETAALSEPAIIPIESDETIDSPDKDPILHNSPVDNSDCQEKLPSTPEHSRPLIYYGDTISSISDPGANQNSEAATAETKAFSAEDKEVAPFPSQVDYNSDMPELGIARIGDDDTEPDVNCNSENVEAEVSRPTQNIFEIITAIKDNPGANSQSAHVDGEQAVDDAGCGDEKTDEITMEKEDDIDDTEDHKPESFRYSEAHSQATDRPDIRESDVVKQEAAEPAASDNSCDEEQEESPILPTETGSEAAEFPRQSPESAANDISYLKPTTVSSPLPGETVDLDPNDEDALLDESSDNTVINLIVDDWVDIDDVSNLTESPNDRSELGLSSVAGSSAASPSPSHNRMLAKMLATKMAFNKAPSHAQTPSSHSVKKLKSESKSSCGRRKRKQCHPVEVEDLHISSMKEAQQKMLSKVGAAKTDNLIIGAYISYYGGVTNALNKAAALGTRCVEFHLNVVRSLNIRPVPDDQAKSFKNLAEKFGYQGDRAIIHGSEMISISTENKRIASTQLIIKEMRDCQKLGVRTYVIKPVLYNPKSFREFAENITDVINSCHDATETDVITVLTMCAIGEKVTGSLLQFSSLVNMIGDKARFGICLDIAELYRAGYDLTSEQGFQSMLSDLDQLGTGYLKVIELNDLTDEGGHRVPVTEGSRLTEGTMKRIVNCPLFSDIPIILNPTGTSVVKNLTSLYSLYK